MEENIVSSWTDYPYNYKYMSVHFELNMDISHTDRTSYDLLNMISDVGGVLEILVILFTLLASRFARVRI